MRVIQNNALRSIYKKKRQFGNIQLHELAQEISIDTRLNDLKQRYIQKCIDHTNPVIVPLINEFKSYSNGRQITIRTPLCLTDEIETHNDEPSYDPNSDHIQLGDGQVIQTDFYSSFNMG